MATSYKTPGVYIEEIPKLPPSVAQVETAIPAFIGFTEKAEKSGESIAGIPTAVDSLVEFEDYFGGAYAYQAGDLEVKLNELNNFAVTEVSYINKVFYLYDSIRLFYANGGGKCYIVSAALYADDMFTNGVLDDANDLSAGLAAIEKYDEPTILLFPDAVNLAEPEFYALQQAAISQCAKLQDRVTVLDLSENGTDSMDEAVTEFRDNIGISNLKYAAAYTPWLYTSFARRVDFELFRDNVVDSADNPIDLSTDVSTDADLNALVITGTNATDDLQSLETSVNTVKGSAATLADKYNTLRAAVMLAPNDGSVAQFQLLSDFVSQLALAFPTWRSGGNAFSNIDLINALDAAGSDSVSGLRKYITELVAFEKNANIDVILTGHTYTTYDDVPLADTDSWIGVNNVAAIAASSKNYGSPVAAPATPAEHTANRNTVIAALADLDVIFKGLNDFVTRITLAGETYQKLAQDALYANHPVIGNIVRAIKKQMSKLPPSGAVVGVYARVDSARGVWKAPANESINSVIGTTTQVTAEDQSSLNVDTIAGKSINVIRAFAGKSPAMIWGARTLAGNDNEWRYVSVRRFFNMVEESCKRATEPFVFEPNDANTWVKVQGMIENFLTTMWRAGALQGAKPEHAFYVAVGLGKTMTALDILEGRMIIEIGMAVVRPAEFIILRFSHKMAES
jgi:phage tail sheath protein FI